MSDDPRNVNFRWSAEFLARLDAARGDVPRSAYVRRALERQMAEDEARLAREAAASRPLAFPDSGRFAVPRSQSIGLGKGPVAPRPKGAR